MRARALAVASLAFVLALACTKKNPKYCDAQTPCATGTCDTGAHQCVANTDGGDAGADAGDAGDARDASDATDASDASDVAPKCMASTQCADGGADSGGPVCEVEAGLCVGCVVDSDCTPKKTAPICEAHVCRACKTDAECPDPNICMTDGHCAAGDDVVFVEFKATGCPGADGSSANPYCLPGDATPHLTSMRSILVIRGSANGQLVLTTSGVAPVVIGKPSASGVPASIPANASTAITVSSDSVLIRDLAIKSGSDPASKGIAVSGNSTALKLVNVQVTLMTDGLGVQASSSAQLTMDRCTVTNNPVGGLLINGAGYDIQNSIFGGNGYGVQFSTPKAPGPFRFNTVVGTVAAICDLANGETLSDSIVVGPAPNCTLQECITTMPTFSSSRPYHLTTKLACPNADASAPPDHDVDGDPRTQPLDCGADQFVP
jgi:hypothetical protein